ncbi:hypothetical protein EV421DRAFT_1747164 [Armillaria borealis]|uniref:F-box domain-containing protein n=1 Tax=Armillaria borealis TaxID=47425 RepID=A0AA39IDE3_9AGAR|nr:hypothetical protein EV421DRAFT_1747164 [Armillaria borealis]
MDGLAPELKDRIVWFASANRADVSTLSLVNHSFLDPSRRYGHHTLRISDSTLPLDPYDMYTPSRKAYLAKCNRRTPGSVARALRDEFHEVGEYVRRVIFDTTYLQTVDVLAMYDLVDHLPRLKEVVLENTDLSFFTTSLCTLLGALDGISMLTLKTCCVDAKSFNILMNGAIAKLQSLSIGARTVGWEGEALAYQWFRDLQFQDLRFLMLHVHHEVDAAVVEPLLLKCGCLTGLVIQLSLTVEGQGAFDFFLRSLATLPRPSLCSVDLLLVYCPRDWPKPTPKSAKTMDNMLCKLIDQDGFQRMVVGFCRVHSSRRVEALAKNLINKGLRELKAKVGGRLLTEENYAYVGNRPEYGLGSKCKPGDRELGFRHILCMDKLAPETIAHILSYAKQSDLRSLALVERRLLSPARKGMFYSLHVTESLPNYALMRSRTYNLYCVRELTFSGAVLSEKDIYGLLKLLRQLPLLRTFTLKGIRLVDHGERLHDLSSALGTVESLNLIRCDMHAPALDAIFQYMHSLVHLSVDGEGQLWLLEDNLDLSVADGLCRLTHLYLETPCLPFDCEANKLDWLKRVVFPELQVLQISIRYDYWLDHVQLLLQWAVNIRHLILDVYPYHCIESRHAERASDHSNCLVSLAGLGHLWSLSIITGLPSLKMVERTLGTLSKAPLQTLSIEFAYCTKRWLRKRAKEFEGVDEAITKAVDLERLNCMEVFSRMHEGWEDPFLCAASVMITERGLPKTKALLGKKIIYSV